MGDVTIPSVMIGRIKDYCEAKVPVALEEAGLSPVEDFLERPPTNDRALQLAVYGAEGQESGRESRDAFIIQVQLPFVEDPVPYLDVIWPILLRFDPALIGYVTKEATYQAWYPGEIGGGFGGSFLYFELECSKDNDDSGYAEDDEL